MTARERFIRDVVRAVERIAEARLVASPEALPSLDAALAALYGAVMVAVFVPADGP